MQKHAKCRSASCRICRPAHKAKRSGVKPITRADKSLSVKHLKDSIDYNRRHIRDHQNLEKHGGSRKYNEAHIKGHEKAMKKDKKLLEERKGEMGKKIAAYRKRKRTAANPKSKVPSFASSPRMKPFKNAPLPKILLGPKLPNPNAAFKLKRAMRKMARTI